MIHSLFLKHKDNSSLINLQKMLQDISDAQTQLLNYQSGIQITNREMGEVVYSILPILSPNYMELDGRTFNESDYPNFFKYLRLLKAKYPEYFCSSEEYDAYMSEYHICPLFFIDEDNLTARIPRVSGLVEASGIKTHGFYGYNTISEETVPNLKGDFGSITGANSTRFTYADTHTGVFSNTDNRNTKYYTSRTAGDTTNNEWGLSFDASAYDSRYKDGAKVHPQTTVLKVYMVVGRDSAYPHVVYSWRDDNNFVRVYSDGYCTQEGKIEPSMNTTSEITFNFPFSGNVNVQITPYRLGGSDSASYLVSSITNTAFTVDHSQNLGMNYLATGKVDLSIIPTEVDYRTNSSDLLEVMEYEKSIKDKLANVEIVLEMPPEEERDPSKMYIVVSPDNIKVVQDVSVTNNYYGSQDQEEIGGFLSATFTHSGEYGLETSTEHEVFTPTVDANNLEQTFTFEEFDSIPVISELSDDNYVKEITKSSVTIGYKGFTPDIHDDTTSSEFSSENTEKGEKVNGTLKGTLYHSGEFTTNVEEKSEQFEFVSPDEDYTLVFTNEYDSVPTITPAEESEIEIISISTTQAVIRGQGSGSVSGTYTTRVFDTETKSAVSNADITLSKEYIEPQLIIPDNSDVEITMDGQIVHVKGTLTADVNYPDGVQTSKEFEFEVIETHSEEVIEPTSDPEPTENPENTNAENVEE